MRRLRHRRVASHRAVDFTVAPVDPSSTAGSAGQHRQTGRVETTELLPAHAEADGRSVRRAWGFFTAVRAAEDGKIA